MENYLQNTAEILVSLIDSKEMNTEKAREIIEKGGGLARMGRMSVLEIARSGLLSESQAAKLSTAIALGKKALFDEYNPESRLVTSREVYSYLLPRVGWPRVEEFWIMGIDVKQRPVNLELIARGGFSEVTVPMASIFRQLIMWDVPRGICCHTHPSGDPEPSAMDIGITDRILEAASFLDIKIIDHIILGKGCYTSLADMGYV
ncbi:hypothetical protein KKF34_19890 [Myxococcota bacterium]|nr:hypothetical protein [Myxococcota bacterium]MBU1380853.1 hypothetical protein [Myxococcota bacterium]MBU1499150.1 hypothetical protein [Myxococcota bacterium]